MKMDKVIERIDNRLSALIRSPTTFGGQEAREAMAVLLIELRDVALGRTGYDAHSNMIKFVRENVDSTCGANRLYERKFPEVLFNRLLDQFIREQIMLQGAA
jgi:hypothetical protein